MDENLNKTRVNYGRRAGIFGVIGNCVLFLIKFAMGTTSNSIAVIADSFNNLMDCAGSAITIIGFHIAGKERDSRHPFGHGRAEYLCGLFIALIIISAAVSLAKNSMQRLISPEPLHVTSLMFLVPLASVLIKTFLIIYITKINRKLNSSALRAAVREDYADMLITVLTLFTLVAAGHTTLPLDGIAGLIIAVFILWSGLTALKENMDLLIGTAADSTLSADARAVVLEYDVFETIVSFTIHDYGPSAKLAVICVSLNPKYCTETGCISAAVSEVSRRLRESLGLNCVIYCRPEEI